MVLSKVNKSNPNDLAKKIEVELLKIDKDIEKIEIVKPGFINITFKNTFWNKFIQNVINQKLEYGTNLIAKKKSFFLEFVSANPTGPLHVGHCRGAVSGDVLANILKFNNHKVHKEYYVNDYGNQIINFTKSVFYRIKEQTDNEPFPKDNEDLYPGDYIIQIAKNIINDNKGLDFKNFDKISDRLTILAVNESIKIIKSNLKNIGIVHDKFQSEREIVNNNELGEITNIQSSFGFKVNKIKPDSRLFNKNLGGGAILDVGCYPLSILNLFYKDPDSYKFLNIKGNLTHTDVDDFAEAEIEINKKIRCQIKVSFKENYQNKTIIEGQKGKLIINSPWLPEKQTNLEISQGSSYYKKIVKSDLSLYANQIEKVSDNFEKNKKDDKFLVNIQSSLAIMKNMSIWSKLIKK